MDRLKKIFSEVLGVDAASLSDQSSPENIQEWDSIKAMELVGAIEEEFSVEFTTKEIMGMRSIGLVRTVLEKKGVVVG